MKGYDMAILAKMVKCNITSPTGERRSFNEKNCLLFDPDPIAVSWSNDAESIDSGYAIIKSDVTDVQEWSFNISTTLADVVQFFNVEGEYELEYIPKGIGAKRKFVVKSIEKNEFINRLIIGVTVTFTTPFFINLIVFGMRSDSSWTLNELYSGGF